MVEHRKSARHPVTLATTFTLDGVTHETTLVNLSVGGALVSFDVHVSASKRVELSFRIPTHEPPIRVGGTTRWQGDRSVGVQFDGLRAKEVWALNKFLDSLDS